MKRINQEPRRLNHTGYVVFCVSILFKYCLSCGCLASALNVCTRGSMLIVELLCYKVHKNIWRSQQVINRYALGDLKPAASTLYIANTYAKLEAFFKLANIPFTI